MVMTRERWEQEPQLSEETDAEVKQVIGRWLLTDFAIECPSSSYQITYDRLNEPDWFYHLLEKTWFYDPTDFLDAYEGARTLALPDETAMARSQATERQLGERRNPFPYCLCAFACFRKLPVLARAHDGGGAGRIRRVSCKQRLLC